MNVGELKSDLDNYGDHVTVIVRREIGDDVEESEIQGVDDQTTPDGVYVVIIA